MFFIHSTIFSHTARCTIINSVFFNSQFILSYKVDLQTLLNKSSYLLECICQRNITRMYDSCERENKGTTFPESNVMSNNDGVEARYDSV